LLFPLTLISPRERGAFGASVREKVKKDFREDIKGGKKGKVKKPSAAVKLRTLTRICFVSWLCRIYSMGGLTVHL